LFKLIRIFIFSLSTIVCMGWTALYSVLLIHGWSTFMVEQRAIVLLLISIYGLSSVVLYLMIVVRFRLWMDGARIAFLFLFQAGGTVTFFLFKPLPANCHNIGPETTCKTIEDIVIFGGWSLSGLLLIYGLLLGIMSYIPAPMPLPNPEDALAVNFGNEKLLANEKRESAITVGSQYSQLSFFGPAPPAAMDTARMDSNYHRPKTPSSTRSIAPSTLYPNNVTRASSITRPSKTGYNYYYRPGAPGSVRSTTTASNTQGLTDPRYNYMYQSRVATPNGPYDPRYARSLTPPSLVPGVYSQNTSPPLTYGPNVAAPPFVESFPSPIPLQSAPSRIQPPRPGGNGHMPSRSRSVPSVPRSPSPQNLSFNVPVVAMPVSAMLRTANESISRKPLGV